MEPLTSRVKKYSRPTHRFSRCDLAIFRIALFPFESRNSWLAKSLPFAAWSIVCPLLLRELTFLSTVTVCCHQSRMILLIFRFDGILSKVIVNAVDQLGLSFRRKSGTLISEWNPTRDFTWLRSRENRSRITLCLRENQQSLLPVRVFAFRVSSSDAGIFDARIYLYDKHF